MEIIIIIIINTIIKNFNFIPFTKFINGSNYYLLKNFDFFGVIIFIRKVNIIVIINSENKAFIIIKWVINYITQEPFVVKLIKKITTIN